MKRSHLDGLVYRLCQTSDPEERLEDAALWKALYDTFGDGITLLGDEDPVPEDALFLGRELKKDVIEAASSDRGYHPFQDAGLPYWEDPGFLAHAGREIWLEDLFGAETRVRDLHAEGRGAFLKSTWQKFQTLEIPAGTAFNDALGPMAFSYADMGKVLLVQEHVPMFYERRYLVINREIVTESPVAWHLTPLDGDMSRMHFRTPKDRRCIENNAAADRMREKAEEVIRDAELDHFCLDLCLLGEDLETAPVAAIEFNPMQPGQVGLYACDPRKIAAALPDALPEDLRAKVAARQAGDLPKYQAGQETEIGSDPEYWDARAKDVLGTPLDDEDFLDDLDF